MARPQMTFENRNGFSKSTLISSYIRTMIDSDKKEGFKCVKCSESRAKRFRRQRKMKGAFADRLSG